MITGRIEELLSILKRIAPKYYITIKKAEAPELVVFIDLFNSGCFVVRQGSLAGIAKDTTKSP